MGSMIEKLSLVKEAEEKAGQTRLYYERMAKEAITKASEEAESVKEKEEAKAREQGEMEMKNIIENANKEAEELRIEYMYDRIRLREVVVERRQNAIAFLVERLVEGD
ncbi:MAG: hypothetical protein A2W01_05920 [Candidatus Solincola sediminis]|nr:MAG: hypothetical protein A2W01_05920 [Candidatus Solincola sediminis]